MPLATIAPTALQQIAINNAGSVNLVTATANQNTQLSQAQTTGGNIPLPGPCVVASGISGYVWQVNSVFYQYTP